MTDKSKESQETWRCIKGWENVYKVSNLGEVYSIRSSKKLKILKCNNGYYAVNLTRKGEREQKAIHRAVLESFRGKCPENMEGCHNDGNRRNNCLSNLRWDTRKNNHADKKRHGTYQIGESASHYKLTNKAVLEIRASNKTERELAEIYGVGSSTIHRAKHKKVFSHI